MKVVMVIQLPAVLEPDDFRPRFPRGHANEHDFVAQDVLVVEVRRLCDAGSLQEEAAAEE